MTFAPQKSRIYDRKKAKRFSSSVLESEIYAHQHPHTLKVFGRWWVASISNSLFLSCSSRSDTQRGAANTVQLCQMNLIPLVNKLYEKGVTFRAPNNLRNTAALLSIKYISRKIKIFPKWVSVSEWTAKLWSIKL